MIEIDWKDPLFSYNKGYFYNKILFTGKVNVHSGLIFTYFYYVIDGQCEDMINSDEEFKKVIALKVFL